MAWARQVLSVGYRCWLKTKEERREKIVTGRKLGKGLESLLSVRRGQEEDQGGVPLWVSVEQLRPNSQQPRVDRERGIDRLAESIRRHGVLQPIIVTGSNKDGYEILAGERRWRAAAKAGLQNVPVIVRPPLVSDAERLELALIENVQREDLDPIERAQACHRLLSEYRLTQEDVAERLGYERSTVANLVRLLELPQEIQQNVSRGTISAGHGRALLRLNGHPEQAAVLGQIVEGQFSVRQAEECVAHVIQGGKKPAHIARPRLPGWAQGLQEKIVRGLGVRCEVRLYRKGGGNLVLHFQDLDELDRLTQRFNLPSELSELEG